MTFSRFACAALFALSFAGASAAQQPVLEVGAKDPRLSQTWYENEGQWRGTWSPANPDQYPGDYIANWEMGSERANARLHIRISGQVVEIVRTQPDGQHCNYRGTLNQAGNTVTGTYSCDWARRAMPWRAAIGSGHPRSASDRPYFTNTQAYLGFAWSVREGDWHGSWRPHTPGVTDGHYDAHYVMRTESANADLMITIEEGTGVVHVLRTDPGGRTCNYTGQIRSSVLSITGHYRCSDQPRNLLPWSATIVRP